MGWSLQAVGGDLKRIFKEKKWNATYISSPYPKVIITYEGKIYLDTVEKILALFPDFVYIDFQPGTLFSEGTNTGIAGMI